MRESRALPRPRCNWTLAKVATGSFSSPAFPIAWANSHASIWAAGCLIRCHRAQDCHLCPAVLLPSITSIPLLIIHSSLSAKAFQFTHGCVHASHSEKVTLHFIHSQWGLTNKKQQANKQKTLHSISHSVSISDKAVKVKAADTDTSVAAHRAYRGWNSTPCMKAESDIFKCFRAHGQVFRPLQTWWVIFKQ